MQLNQIIKNPPRKNFKNKLHICFSFFVLENQNYSTVKIFEIYLSLACGMLRAVQISLVSGWAKETKLLIKQSKTKLNYIAI